MLKARKKNTALRETASISTRLRRDTGFGSIRWEVI